TTTGGNGTVLVADRYTFNGSTLPERDTEGKFNFWVQTDNAGSFTLSGRSLITDPGVFLNGLAITNQAIGNKVYRIDIDSTDGGGSPIETMPGWTSLDASGIGTSTDASVAIDGINFSTFSTDGSRIRRASGNPDDNLLTSDFIFDDGPGQSVGLTFGGAGDLEAGTWLVEMYIWDSQSGGLPDDLIVGLRRNNAETIISTAVKAVEHGAAITFEFESDGIGAYDVFVRDATGTESTIDRTRLNAVTLALVPEPSSLALLGLGGLLVARRRR
ncbi:MAG: PEP-CTERM sorting domain-containing protein, partial [Planctomycetota bacterium]